MPKTQVLLVGESWVSAATPYKGFDQFSSVHRGAEPLLAALPVTMQPFDDRIEASEGFKPEIVGPAGHPLLVTGRHGAGRTLAWTSDIGPHWLPHSFVQWPGYGTLWRNALGWVAGAA